MGWTAGGVLFEVLAAVIFAKAGNQQTKIETVNALSAMNCVCSVERQREQGKATNFLSNEQGFWDKQGTEHQKTDWEAKKMKKFLYGMVSRTCGRGTAPGEAANDALFEMRRMRW